MRSPSRLALILDLDGVVIESVDGKAEAFVATFAARWPAQAQAVRDYNRRHFGVPRARKMRHLLARIAPDEPRDALLDSLLTDYASRLAEAVRDFALVAGVRDLLTSGAHDVFICSAAPMTEIEAILAHHRLRPMVRGIFDGTTPKGEALRRIATGHEGPVLFVGDAEADLRAATEAGVPFILRISGPEADTVTAPLRMTDFREFDRLIAPLFQ